ncbi:hypothetical protein G6F31_018691 [Rhizopus arrhizus]|nr:hypothetical protein G6F31_018691 [Rhizopus arrhizus]
MPAISGLMASHRLLLDCQPVNRPRKGFQKKSSLCNRIRTDEGQQQAENALSAAQENKRVDDEAPANQADQATQAAHHRDLEGSLSPSGNVFRAGAHDGIVLAAAARRVAGKKVHGWRYGALEPGIEHL